MIKLILIIALIISFPKTIVHTKETVKPAVKQVEKEVKNKSIYIYSTHQEEEYKGGDVMDGSEYLMELLVDQGYEVKVDQNDFSLYRIKNDMDYDECYSVSKKYILQELDNKNDYDLIIDFHRDSIPKDLSTITYDNKSYAKVMFVVGKGSENYKDVKKMSSSLSSIINEHIPKLSRGIYEKKSHYNQGLAKNMVLIEVGANKNTYQEVKNTIHILAYAIDQYLSQ